MNSVVWNSLKIFLEHRKCAGKKCACNCWMKYSIHVQWVKFVNLVIKISLSILVFLWLFCEQRCVVSHFDNKLSISPCSCQSQAILLDKIVLSFWTVESFIIIKWLIISSNAFLSIKDVNITTWDSFWLEFIWCMCFPSLLLSTFV